MLIKPNAKANDTPSTIRVVRALIERNRHVAWRKDRLTALAIRADISIGAPVDLSLKRLPSARAKSIRQSFPQKFDEEVRQITLG